MRRSPAWPRSIHERARSPNSVFGGLSLEETGHSLGLSIATVEREWQAARAWLFAALKGTAPS